MRGNEESSVLIAVRDEPGCELKMLDVERKAAGVAKKTGLETKKQTLQGPSEPTEKRIQYSRIMIAKVTLPSSVGVIKTEHNVMVMHMHNELANNVHGARSCTSFGSACGQRSRNTM